ncbi:hypothetical protein BD560DRAFT_427287 [Blakeslea trispora]|nr:hypothetical protein BD560DRAFT_427287 [Blakeslea trispora]
MVSCTAKRCQMQDGEDDFESVDEIEKKIRACCQVLKEKSQIAIQDSSETSFMQKHLVPYLEEIFLKDPIEKYHLCSVSITFLLYSVDGVEEDGCIHDWKRLCPTSKSTFSHSMQSLDSECLSNLLNYLVKQQDQWFNPNYAAYLLAHSWI